MLKMDSLLNGMKKIIKFNEAKLIINGVVDKTVGIVY